MGLWVCAVYIVYYYYLFFGGGGGGGGGGGLGLAKQCDDLLWRNIYKYDENGQSLESYKNPLNNSWIHH